MSWSMAHHLSPVQKEMFDSSDDSEVLLIEEDDGVIVIDEDSTGLEEEAPLENRKSSPPLVFKQSSVQSLPQSKCWPVLIVDDDQGVHQATQIALQNFTFEGLPIAFISAFSAEEGKQILSNLSHEFAVILLDVVMESTHAGLELVEFVRDSLQNDRVRIILRTGQPGEAPSESVILDYDINDYQLKLDMTRQRLITSLVSALRSYRDLVIIDAQNNLLSEALTRLQQSEQELKHYSHNLELLVSERTEELQTANEQLKRLAKLDGLTQVANRQYFDCYLQDHWLKAIQTQTHIALLLVDVDYFKLFNDYYGHLAGDDALKQVSRVLASTLERSQDLVARYGGEEFGIILPQTNYSGAQRLANNICQTIVSLKIPHAGSQVHEFLTISTGASCLIPQAGMEPECLIEMADIALYKAKSRDRNQFCLYRDIMAESSTPV